MKVALLISGYLRSFKLNLPSIKSKIIDKFGKVDVYIHITKNENEDKYLNNNTECDIINFINQSLNPICLLYEPNIFYSHNKKVNDMMNLWSKYYKLNEIKKINETKESLYDIVIKYRPDMDILSDIDYNFIRSIGLSIFQKIR